MGTLSKQIKPGATLTRRGRPTKENLIRAQDIYDGALQANRHEKRAAGTLICKELKALRHVTEKTEEQAAFIGKYLQRFL